MPRFHVVMIAKVTSGEKQRVAQRVGLGTGAIDSGEVFSVWLESVHHCKRSLSVVLRRFANKDASYFCLRHWCVVGSMIE